MISRRNGKTLDIRTPPDHPGLVAYLSFFKVLLTRKFNPLRSVTVETINNKAALTSDFAEPLKAFGFAKSYKGLELRKEYPF
jgi:hypothetical protein